MATLFHAREFPADAEHVIVIDSDGLKYRGVVIGGKTYDADFWRFGCDVPSPDNHRVVAQEPSAT